MARNIASTGWRVTVTSTKREKRENQHEEEKGLQGRHRRCNDSHLAHSTGDSRRRPNFRFRGTLPSFGQTLLSHFDGWRNADFDDCMRTTGGLVSRPGVWDSLLERVSTEENGDAVNHQISRRTKTASTTRGVPRQSAALMASKLLPFNFFEAQSGIQKQSSMT